MELVCRVFMVKPDKVKDYDDLPKMIDEWWRPTCKLLLYRPNEFLHKLQSGQAEHEQHCTDKVIRRVRDMLECLEDDGGVEGSRRCSLIGHSCHLWPYAFVEAWGTIGGEGGREVIRAEETLRLAQRRMAELNQVVALDTD